MTGAPLDYTAAHDLHSMLAKRAASEVVTDMDGFMRVASANPGSGMLATLGEITAAVTTDDEVAWLDGRVPTLADKRRMFHLVGQRWQKVLQRVPTVWLSPQTCALLFEVANDSEEATPAERSVTLERESLPTPEALFVLSQPVRLRGRNVVASKPGNETDLLALSLHLPPDDEDLLVVGLWLRESAARGGFYFGGVASARFGDTVLAPGRRHDPGSRLVARLIDLLALDQAGMTVAEHGDRPTRRTAKRAGRSPGQHDTVHVVYIRGRGGEERTHGPSAPDGSRRAHWVRGHYRRQRYGPMDLGDDRPWRWKFIKPHTRGQGDPDAVPTVHRVS